MSTDSIELRRCHDIEDLRACVRLQKEVWNFTDAELVPLRMFVVADKVGGQVMGAFEKGAMVGFALSVPGTRSGHIYLHSHMLAVRVSHRNRGLGAQLKWEQRREALSRGIRHMEWTFDPLEIKNAFLNIHRLGATASQYLVDFYGVSSSRLQGGLPTDRLLAEWKLDSPRVQASFDGRPVAEYVIEERILVPASIEQRKANALDRERALAVQLENRQKFQQAFARGLAVLGFARDEEENGVFELGTHTQTELEAEPKEQKK